MRFLPLLSSTLDPAPWISFPAVELVWKGNVHPGWAAGIRRGRAVHALHLEPQSWDEALIGEAMEALRTGLGPDFLVIPADAPANRAERSRFLGSLEAILETLAGRGVKVALRPAPGSAGTLVTLLKEVRCDAVGYCWDATIGLDLEALSDRLFCAVGSPDGDFQSLHHLGYRWNLAVPSVDPRDAARILAHLETSHPMIYFPQVHP